MQNIIELRNVNVIYEGERIPALYNITLDIMRGEFVAVIGPNGAGKTTLLETINGLLQCTSGIVKVFGKDVKKYGNEIRKRIGYVIQNFEIDPLDPFIAKDVAMMGRIGRLGLLRFPKSDDWKIVLDNLKILGVDALADRAIGKLSGGEFQKILIARALSQEPEILLLDEPLSNLDLDSRKRLCELLSDLHESRGLTTIMVSHDISYIPEICSRVIVLDKGRIVCEGGKEEVATLECVSRMLHKGVKHV
ncbi:MAG TPA: metal ABC transporter ATP-binding protein [Thermoplasmatales archaeon]|nr:metal ABC transporter ATP-binding protein [Thermoplasmatales archaeon]